MDQPGLDRESHRRALDGLRTANALSRTSEVIWRGISQAGIVRDNGRPLRILDIATGGGDVLIGLAKLAARQRIAVETHGCDVSATAVEYAQSVATHAKLTGTKFFQLNALVD